MPSGHRIKVWKDGKNEWRWTHLSSSDKVATSGEGLKHKAHALRQVAELFPGVPVEVVGDDEPGAE